MVLTLVCTLKLTFITGILALHSEEMLCHTPANCLCARDCFLLFCRVVVGNQVKSFNGQSEDSATPWFGITYQSMLHDVTKMATL